MNKFACVVVRKPILAMLNIYAPNFIRKKINMRGIGVRMKNCKSWHPTLTKMFFSCTLKVINVINAIKPTPVNATNNSTSIML